MFEPCFAIVLIVFDFVCVLLSVCDDSQRPFCLLFKTFVYLPNLLLLQCVMYTHTHTHTHIPATPSHTSNTLHICHKMHSCKIL